MEPLVPTGTLRLQNTSPVPSAFTGPWMWAALVLELRALRDPETDSLLPSMVTFALPLPLVVAAVGFSAPPESVAVSSVAPPHAARATVATQAMKRRFAFIV